MPSEEHEKKTLNLRKGDWSFLTDTYQPKGVSTSELVRTLVSKHVDKLRAASPSVSIPGKVDL